MLEAVIIDWDGTLADTRQVVVASFQSALNEIHCKTSYEFIEQLIGIRSTETSLQKEANALKQKC
jgi:beta-phosphoglucomutase-like phosphatase (HAD superfamily)